MKKIGTLSISLALMMGLAVGNIPAVQGNNQYTQGQAYDEESAVSEESTESDEVTENTEDTESTETDGATYGADGKGSDDLIEVEDFSDKVYIEDGFVKNNIMAIDNRDDVVIETDEKLPESKRIYSAEIAEDSEVDVDVNKASSIPDKFTLKKLSGIRYQGQYGVCWAYCANTCLETAYLNQGLGDSINYSEYQLLYATFHGEKDKFVSSVNPWYDQGGFNYMAIGTLAMNRAMALDSQYPFDTSKTLTKEDIGTGVNNIKEAVLLPDFPEDYSNYAGDQWFAVINNIKKEINNGHAIGIALDASTSKYDSSKKSYYTSWNGGDKPGTNHEAVIVGWDDSKITSAGSNKPGAFYIHNSWSTNHGENGYDWISYYDASLSSPGYYTVSSDPVDNEECVYSHSEAGWMGKGLSMSKNTFEGVNVFVAEEDFTINKIGFYTNYEADYVIDFITDIPSNNNFHMGATGGTVSGHVDNAGFYKVDYDHGFTVKKGEKFAISINLKDMNGKNRIFFEGGNRSLSSDGLSRVTTISSGESFIFANNTWIDCSDVFGNFNLGQDFRNICVYAYGKKASSSNNEQGGTQSPVISGVSATQATLYNPGNIAFYICDGKKYADAECTKELKDSDIVTYLFDKDLVGPAKYNGNIYYVKNGIVDKTFEGIVKYNNLFYAFKEGVIDKSKKGVIFTNKTYILFRDGAQRSDYSGLSAYNDKFLFMKEGHFYKYTGFSKRNDSYYYVKEGVTGKATGFRKGKINKVDAWWYIKNGTAFLTSNGFFKGTVEGKSGWWYVKNGKVITTTTGYVKGTVDGVSGWWYVTNGKVSTGKSGIFKGTVNGKTGKWYVKAGRVQLEYSGTRIISNSKFVIKKGLVQ